MPPGGLAHHDFLNEISGEIQILNDRFIDIFYDKKYRDNRVDYGRICQRNFNFHRQGNLSEKIF